MKKFAAGLSILLLSSCLQAGDYSILPQRNSFFEAWDSYPIDYYDTDLQLVKSEYITEREFEPNKILSVYVGYSVADLKTYRKDFFKAEYVRPAMDGVLNSASIPVAYTKKEKLQVIGEVTIDGERYMLLPTKQDKAVVLINGDGVPYEKMGQIRNGRLVLMLPDYIPYPANFYFEPVITSKTEQTKPVKGYDIKYGGVKLDRMLFTYYDYSSSGGDNGRFENISFPNKPGLIDIYGVGIKVLHAGNQKLDYILMPE